MEDIDQELIKTLAPSLRTAGSMVVGLIRARGEPQVSTANLFRESGIPHVRHSEAISILDTLKQYDVVKESDGMWIILYTHDALIALGYALQGAQILKEESYKIIELERPEIVLTRPRAPSLLDEVIGSDTTLSVHIENTEDAFTSLAASSRHTLTIMTPFLDVVGARWAVTLFEAASESVSKELILRFLDDSSSDQYPEGLPSILTDLQRMKVKIFDYAVPRPDTPTFFETFHAKVIIADGVRAYVGSANLNRHSKDTSMELGMLVSGPAANRLNVLLDKVRRIAKS